ncbi:ATP-dependent DNA helicase DDX11 [Sitophilus oryzae]|uniref:ATP-dependent DNA helicase DDX11 n=1 Tax=Sitophilus oryzae TaxID=7048 RepID=A0A6J2YM16_SITOR|nr:ATP-dependent DNA helicase DDX11 [Sitophilus oryzae]
MDNDFILKEPDEFPFPFPPYNIQLEFMQKLYFALENRKMGIFESPTGTGKSLSIICGAIKWLKDHEQREKDALSEQITSLELEKVELAKEEKDWFKAQSKEIIITQKLNHLKIEENKILAYKEKIDKIKAVNVENTRIKNPKPKIIKESVKLKLPVSDLAEEKAIDDEDILLEEKDPCDVKDESSDEEDENMKYHPTQIIIASRTHSQLSQFIGELKKSPFCKDLRVVSLASRQNYCINSNVKKLNNMNLINEKCIDMQKKQKSKTVLTDEGKSVKKQKTSNCQCPYYKQNTIEDLKHFTLSEIHDIEDLVQIGKEISACPYYSSRKAAEDAEIILVPYNTLLHKSTREANGINLKNNIVIIDEAHNLLEALAQMYGCEVSYSHLYYSLHQIKCYKERYNTMFSASTLRHLNQLIFVLNKLLSIFDKDVKEIATEIFTLENFVLSAGIEQYNFFNLIKFCKSSRITQKVRSYSIKYPIEAEMIKKPTKKSSGVKSFLASISKTPKPEKNEENPPEKLKIPIPNNPILPVVSLLDSLNYSQEDGRILVTRNSQKHLSKIQFLLLNPSSNFSDIVSQARSVIVAGGTMKPYAEFKDRLFINSGVSPDKIFEFSCDHIIPPENILPIAVTKGHNGEKLLFNFSNRMSLASSLKDILKETCQNVNGGIVVFFPSYTYENWVYDQVKNMNFGRPLFREPQNSGSVDEVLNKYSATIAKSTNALLFSVVGGKLSEGLNFSDNLGRCVIVVGLPYPNIMSPDLKEKMGYLDNKEGAGAGQKFYENLCMKAVNQCIGRSVRHKNDYATVLLLDERYSKVNVQKALPNWIQRSLKVCNFAETFVAINQFFKKKNKQAD